jgi:hypothetical protein
MEYSHLCMDIDMDYGVWNVPYGLSYSITLWIECLQAVGEEWVIIISIQSIVSQEESLTPSCEGEKGGTG